MQTVVAATEARNNFGKFLNRVYHGDEHLVIEKAGIPVAALVSIREYEQFQRLMASKRLTRMGNQLGVLAKRSGLTEEKLLKELKQDRKAIYQERYGAHT